LKRLLDLLRSLLPAARHRAVAMRAPFAPHVEEPPALTADQAAAAAAAGKSISAKAAHKLIKLGSAPTNLRVSGTLAFSNDDKLTDLPPGLTVAALDLSRCVNLRALPAGLKVRRLNLSGNWNPQHLLAGGVSCYALDLKNTAITALPADVRVEYRLDLEGCTALQHLPEELKVGSLVLRTCTSLESLPEGLEVYFLDISGCTGITDWPARGRIEVGRLAARGCGQLRSLPPWLARLAQLDLRDCTNLRELPGGLVITSWLDVAGTRIRALPPSLAGVQLRWRGVVVDERVAFHPERITVEEVLNEPNAERRRVLLERMGYDRFLAHARADVVNEDRDAGGVRRLLRVPMASDEDLVCVSVICPSTHRQYVIRVPPTTRTCHEAVAWVAGFDDPNKYRPVVET
jgi:hypothetical protein